MLPSLVTRSRNLHGRLVFTRLLWSRHDIPSSLNSVRLRKQLSLLGIGASIAFAIYHETSFTYNDSDELKRTTPKSTKPSNSTSFEHDLNRQDTVIPDWTDNGIYRVDVVSLAANIPIEDASSLYTAAFSPTLRYTFFGVFDGHNGGSTARKLAADLPEVVCLHLADVHSSCASTAPEDHQGETPYPLPASKDIHSAVKEAFIEVDDLIVHQAARQALGLGTEEYRALTEGKESSESANTQPMPLLEGMKLLKHAYAGSCAILGIYNSLERTLHVALTGDSRAVLGRRVLVPPKNVPAGEKEASDQSSATDNTRKYAYQVHQLSFDQNAKNPKEAERLTALHPDEPELLKNNRVLGWGTARAFGDGAMKWSAALQKLLYKKVLGDWPRDALQTPPYFTAEPDVTTFENEVVGLVGKWLEERGSKETIRSAEGDVEVIIPNKVYPTTTIPLPSPYGTLAKDKTDAKSNSGTQQIYGPSDLPVIFPADYDDNTVMYPYWRTEKRFMSVAEDEANVARHVVRNAVGGADRDLSESLYMMEGSRRRRFRDDITIQVIFFD